MEDTRIISLFSGAMGLDLGLEKALSGVASTVVCAESDKSCIKTILSNRPDIEVFDDVSKISKYSVDINPLLVVGGPPCQSWSTAGRRKGFNDPRGSLVLKFGHIIKELRPRFFVMENVRGFLSIETDQKEKAIDVLIDEFDKIGYSTVYGILNSVDFGVPQFRERLIIVGSRDGENIFLPLPTHFIQHQNPLFRWKTLGEIAEFDKHEYLNFSPKRKHWLEKIPEGGNWKSLSEEDQKKAMGNAYNSGGGKTGFFRRLTFKEPAPTLVTSPMQKSTVLCHPTETRPLSIEEYAEIQTFPRDWIFEGTLQNKYKQIGNAVPVKLAEAIGQMILSVINEDHTIETARFSNKSKVNKKRKVIKKKGKKKKTSETDILISSGLAFMEGEDE